MTTNPATGPAKSIIVHATATTVEDLTAVLREVISALEDGQSSNEAQVLATGATYRFDLSEGTPSLSEATTTSINAEEREVKVALSDLCTDIRETFPDAAVLVLDDSDQGDWAYLSEVRDSLGNDIDTGDWEDGDDCAAHLYANRNYIWEPFLVAGTTLDRRNPCRAAVVIDQVLNTQV